MEHYKISREILKLGNSFSLKLHVNLLSDNNSSFINEFNRQNSVKKGLSINHGISFISFDYKNSKKKWSKDKSIIVNDLSLFKVIKCFKLLLKDIYSDRIFAKDKNDKVIIFEEEAKKSAVPIMLGTQHMLLKPSIVEDTNGITYEGVLMYINNLSNCVEMPIDWFENLYYTLEKIDMFEYSQLLLNFYVSYRENKEIQKETDLFKVNNKPKSKEIKSTLIKRDDTFNGLEEKH